MKAIYGTVIALAAPLLFAQQSENIPDFNGIWLAGGGGAPQGGMGAQGAVGAQGGMAAPGGGRGRPRPTASAQHAMDTYDLLVDDPAYVCSPSSLSRTWYYCRGTVSLKMRATRLTDTRRVVHR